MVVRPWQPPLVKLGCKTRPTLCAGYTTRLPEVIEVARAHTHWKNGSLEAFCGGQPTETLLALLEIYDHEVERLGVCAITSKDRGGMREPEGK